MSAMKGFVRQHQQLLPQTSIAEASTSQGCTAVRQLAQMAALWRRRCCIWMHGPDHGCAEPRVCGLRHRGWTYAIITVLVAALKRETNFRHPAGNVAVNETLQRALSCACCEL